MNEGNNNPVIQKTSHALDLIVWGLWAILMWGFLGILAYTSSPKNMAGIHEVIIYSYFLWFSLVYGFIYVYIMKKGV